MNKKVKSIKGIQFFYICLIKFRFSNSMKVFNHTHDVRLHITGKERVNPMSCILLEKNCSEMSLVVIWIKLSSNVSSTFPLAFITVANGIQFCFILSYRNLFLIFKKSIWTSVTFFLYFCVRLDGSLQRVGIFTSILLVFCSNIRCGLSHWFLVTVFLKMSSYEILTALTFEIHSV